MTVMLFFMKHNTVMCRFHINTECYWPRYTWLRSILWGGNHPCWFSLSYTTDNCRHLACRVITVTCNMPTPGVHYIHHRDTLKDTQFNRQPLFLMVWRLCNEVSVDLKNFIRDRGDVIWNVTAALFAKDNNNTYKCDSHLVNKTLTNLQLCWQIKRVISRNDKQMTAQWK